MHPKLESLLSLNGTDDMFTKPVSRCNNLYAMIQYFCKKGGDIKTILKDTELGLDYISNHNNWLSYKELVYIMKGCIDSVENGTIYDFYEAGAHISDYPQSNLFVVMGKLLGTQRLYKLVPRIVNSMVKYASMDLLEIHNGAADFKLKIDDAHNRAGLGNAGYWIAGVLSSVPTVRNDGNAHTVILYQQMCLKNIIEVLYDKEGFCYKESKEGIFVNDRFTGRRVRLKLDAKNNIYTRDLEECTTEPNAVLIVDDVMKNDVCFLKGGDIFDAPYTRIQLSWPLEKGIVRRLKRSAMFFYSRKQLIGEYVKQIELANERTEQAEEERGRAVVARIKAEFAEKKARTANMELQNQITSAKLLTTRMGLRTHNYNNKLMVVTGHLGIAKEIINADPDTYSAIYNDFSEALQYLSSVRGGFTEILIMAKNHASTDKQHIDVLQQLESLVTAKQRSPDNRMIHYETKIESMPHPYLVPKDLDCIIDTVIDNAADELKIMLADPAVDTKSKPRNPTISVCTWYDQMNNAICIAIADNGRGIPQGVDIYNLKQSPKKSISFPVTESISGGNGFGLNSVRTLLEAYGGSIHHESYSNKGTTFFIEIPVKS